MTIPLTGYADRLSVRPGETISFHVSHNESTKAKKNNKVQTSVVRVISADPHTNPGPGIQTVPIRDAEIDCVNEPGPCATQRGSHAELPLPLHALEKDMTFAVAIMPTLLPTGQQQQTIAFVENVLEVYINPKGHLCAQFGTSSSNTTTTLCCSQRVLPKNHWIQIYCSVALLREDESKREALVGWNWLTRDGSGSSAGVSKGRKGESVKEEISLEQSTTSEETTLYLAAKKSSTPTQPPVCIHHFTGRMEHPWLWWTTPGFPELHIGTHAVMQAKAHPPDAQWHFGRGISTQTVQDFGPHKLHGTVVNCPTRGVRGSNWSGREMCWRHAPDDYAAIHFHAETDLADCNWPVCYQWKIPSDIPSGNYALLLHTDEYQENIPFFVVPPKGNNNKKKQADLVLVMSTFTYIIYGNHARGEWIDDPNWKSAWKEQAQQIPGAYPYNPREHGDYGWSTYNNHADGSGICLSSWKRPLLNLRIGYITFPYPDWAGSGLRHYAADTHVTAWLEQQGISYDIVTDWELHNEGYSVLEPYRVVMTGSHPEYHSEQSLNAFRDYRNNGGRIAYMGGNGFYWKIAVGHGKDVPMLEIRRGEGGVRAWASPPGEYYHQLDGQYGGLWRRNGRAPQALVGVGFSAQGDFVGSYYRLRDNIRSNPRVAWMFHGFDDETKDIIGQHGLSGRGAAGFEIDRADVSLGTPEHAIILASSEGHTEDAKWLLVFEERLTHHGNLAGVPDSDLIRADITFFETLSGGAVFSTGSITYCGSLLTNNCQNDISTLTKNVLMKFLDPESTFVVPD